MISQSTDNILKLIVRFVNVFPFLKLACYNVSVIDYLEGLNPAQKRAAEHTDGPLLILAGAGSGKTKTLTHRIAYLLSNTDAQPHNLLAVTFTNKAAGEMRSRVMQLLGRPDHERNFIPYLGTFHSICVRILREEADNIGLSRSFTIFDTSDSKAAIKQAMRELRIDEKKWKPDAIKHNISAAKNELIDAAEYGGLTGTPIQERAAQVYPQYQKILEASHALDFDDLIMKVVQMFKKYPKILDKWRARFTHVMVDEYQDTNAAQYKLIKLLAEKHQNICVVGDDWQSIYSWRGADYRNILNFEKDYPNTVVIKLEQNYRSTKSILDAAQAVIARNANRSDKELWTDEGQGQAVQVYQAMSELDEASFMARMIDSGTSLKERNYRDYAILYRTNAQSRSIEEIMIRYNIPYRIIGGVRFYERKEIKDVLAYLRFAFQADDIVSFKRVVNYPTRGIGDASIDKFDFWRTEQGLTLWEGLLQVGQCSALTTRALNSITKFVVIISDIKEQMEKLELPDLVEFILNRSGLMRELEDGTIQAEERVENVKELISVAREFQSFGVAGFLEEVTLVSDVDAHDADADAITLMTLHAAKGLEFPVVFLPGMEEGLFPHSRAQFDQEEMEEERRLCYVGMTRARQELYLVYATSRMLYGSPMHNMPSRFIDEIDKNNTTERMTSIPGKDDWGSVDEEIHLDAQVNLKPGDSVRHQVFGTGVVKEVDGEDITVIFGKKGRKKLNVAYAPLEKLS